MLAAPKLFADDTPLPVLEPGRGRTKTGRLWCYAVDDRAWQGSRPPAAAYIYSEDRKACHPAKHLAKFRGVLQVDGYSGFASLVSERGDGSIRLAFCWAHARRPFYEFHAATKSDLAAEALERIAKLYAIEADIRGRAQNSAEPCASSAAVRSSKTCTPGCTNSCRVCPAVRRWPPPCATRCVTGRD